MHDASPSHEDPAGAVWLRDDHRVILYTLVSLALVLGGHRTWRGYHRYRENAARRAKIARLVESSRKEKERRGVGAGPSGLLAADASDRDAVCASAGTPPPGLPVAVSHDGLDASRAGSSKTPLTTSPAHDLKARGEGATSGAGAGATKRARDRRKRGRDVYKQALKQERNTSVVVADTDNSNSSRSASLLQVQTTSGSDADASCSRSRSRSRSSSSRARSSGYDGYDDGSTEDTPRPRSNPVTANKFSPPPPETARPATAVDPQYTHETDGRSDGSSFSAASSGFDFMPFSGVVTHGPNMNIIYETSATDTIAVAECAHSSNNNNKNDAFASTPQLNINARMSTPPLTHSGPSSTASESIASSSASASVGAGSPRPSLNLELVIEDTDSQDHLTRDVVISQPVPSIPAEKAQPPWMGFPVPTCPSRDSNRSRNSENKDGESRRHAETLTHATTPSSGSVASLAISDVSTNASASGSMTSSSASGWENENNGSGSPMPRGSPGAILYKTSPGRRRGSKSKSPPPPPRFRSLSRAPGSPYHGSNSLPLPLLASSGLSDTNLRLSRTPPPNTVASAPTSGFGQTQGQGLSFSRTLEQARRREEAHRREAERLRQEYEAMRTKWCEDMERGRIRESELQTQLQQMTSQVHALSLTVSQMQMHARPYFPHPPSHSQQGQQTAPGYLPAPPSMSSVPIPGPYTFPTFSSPGAGPGPGVGLGAYPYPLIATLPRMTPRSVSRTASASASANGSPAKEYAFSEEQSSLFVNGGDGEGGEELEVGVGVSESLVEAILKRPGGFRGAGAGGKSPSVPAYTSPSVHVSSPASGSGLGFGYGYGYGYGCGYGYGDVEVGGQENEGEERERAEETVGLRSASVAGRATRNGFTFASLSELGNPQPGRRVGEEEWMVFGSEEEGRDVVEGSGEERVLVLEGDALLDSPKSMSGTVLGSQESGEVGHCATPG